MPAFIIKLFNTSATSSNTMWTFGFVVLLLAACDALKEPEEVLAWKEVSFAWPTPEAREKALKSGDYVPENNLPLGLARWKDKLFITVPRWKSGVAATLAYVDLKAQNKTPALVPYPGWGAHALPKEGEKAAGSPIIVSTFRVDVDECDRLWVMDTGLADIVGKARQVYQPAIIAYDLKTDKEVLRYPLRADDVKEESFFANIIADISRDKCDEGFIYLPDLGGFALIVYSLAEKTSWRIKHNFFHFDPLQGDLRVGGLNVQWTDGIFGMALGKRQPDGFRTVYFHPLVGIREFSVNSAVIQNRTYATDPHSYYAFKLEGSRGEGTQASAAAFDDKTGVLFLTQLTRDGFACWNTNKPLEEKNVELIAQNKDTMVFTNDIKMDSERNLWLLSDKMPLFVYGKWNSNDVNYRIFKIKVDDAIKGTVCE